MQRIAIPVLLAAALCVPALAHGFLVPLRQQDAHVFPARTDDVHIASLRLDVRQSSAAERPDADARRWDVDLELAVRNRRSRPVEQRLGVVIEPQRAGHTEVLARGVVVPTAPETPRHDGHLRDHHYPDVLGFSLSLAPHELVLLRIRTRVTARTDELGQTWLELPLQPLGLFDDDIGTAWVRIDSRERMIGLRASLTGWTRHDGSAPGASWYVRDWSITRPLRVGWIAPWPMLVRAALVESCPAPWDLLQQVASGQPDSLRAFLDEVDEDARRFCASLPLIVNGYRFSSAEMRERLSGIPLSRYLPGAPDEARLYLPDATFDRDQLSEVERLYMDTLQRFR